MHRRLLVSVVAFVVIAIAVIFVVTLRAQPVNSSTSSVAPVKGFLLDIGASASLGFQPTGIPAHNGHRTANGYDNYVVTAEAARGIALTLRQIGCPGETVESILGQKADACYKLPVTQLNTAEQFLRANQTAVGVVTIDLGFNNIRKCFTVTATDGNCAIKGTAAVQKYLPRILQDLISAAGPNVHFVGLLYADPFLGFYLKGPTGPAAAAQGLQVMNAMNVILRTAYTKSHVAVANVPAAYRSSDATPVANGSGGTIPRNVAEACAMTWMCKGTPWGPDDHPNNVGYKTIGVTIVNVLPKSW